MVKRVIAAFLFSIIAISTASTTVSAKEFVSMEPVKNATVIGRLDTVTPMWTSTNYVRASASASGTAVTASVVARAANLNTYCSGTLYVDRYQNGGWTNVASWWVGGTGTINTSRIYYGSRGYSYRSRVSLNIGNDQIVSYSSSISVW